MANPLEWALRVVESTAFFIHGILGMTEPCTGCLRSAFQDKGAMPPWFWPVAGMLLWVVAASNFSQHESVVLVAQAYIAAFHLGGFFYHVRIGHQPLVGCAPGIFVVFAFIITTIRTNLVVGFVGLLVCTVFAFVLSRILVTPPPSDGDRQRPSQEANLLS